ncbi:hypothetical protein HDV57DRAFT_486815 [Trichoderma longibrachiatum]
MSYTRHPRSHVCTISPPPPSLCFLRLHRKLRWRPVSWRNGFQGLLRMSLCTRTAFPASPYPSSSLPSVFHPSFVASSFLPLSSLPVRIEQRNRARVRKGGIMNDPLLCCGGFDAAAEPTNHVLGTLADATRAARNTWPPDSGLRIRYFVLVCLLSADSLR